MKIADFGFACPSGGSSGTGVCTTKVGTEGYKSPELLLGKYGYNGPMADIFALGVSLFIMVARDTPFDFAYPSE